MTRWWASLQVQPALLRLHGPGLEQKNTGDDLKTVGNAVLHLLEQNFLCWKQIVLFALSLTTPSYVLDRQKNGGGRTILSNTRRALRSITRRPIDGNSCSTS